MLVISMSKETMIKYLRDYASLLYMVMKNPEKRIGSLFDLNMYKECRLQDDTREYYDTMRRVYSDYIFFKKFSIIEDFLLNRDDYLNNNELSGIETDCQIIEAPSNLTNKKIIQLIRNAFNHNNSEDMDRFKISVNGRYFEIEFKDIRTLKEIENNIPPKPVKIKFNANYLSKVNNIINEKRQNQFIISFDIPNDFDFYSDNLNVELDKISVKHYHFPKKMTKSEIERFNKLMDTKNLSYEELISRSDELHDFAKTISEPTLFNLNYEQKKKIISLIERYKKMYPDLLKDNMYAMMYYFLEKVIPVPSFKNQILSTQLILSESYLSDVDLSLKEILNRVSLIIDEKGKKETYDEIDCEIHDEISKTKKSFQIGLYNDMLDGEIISLIPLIMYIDSVITHYCIDNEITIDGITYSTEKIRNSFAHVRWFVDENLNLVMYDADPKNINCYNLECVGKINIESFVMWADEYVSEKYKNNNYKK